VKLPFSHRADRDPKQVEGRVDDCSQCSGFYCGCIAARKEEVNTLISMSKRKSHQNRNRELT